MSEAELRIGGLKMTRREAANDVRRYLDTEGQSVYGYPYYDCLTTTANADELADGDFLAPVLLNAPITLEAFKSLTTKRDVLVELLKAVPMDRDLADAQPADLDAVAALFGLLDDHDNFQGVQGAVLSKILHRKRPRIIPLYDRKIRAVYRDMRDAPIPIDKGRSWREFMLLLLKHMRTDLIAAPDVWADLGQGLVTPLRALDIVAWSRAELARKASHRD